MVILARARSTSQAAHVRHCVYMRREVLQSVLSGACARICFSVLSVHSSFSFLRPRDHGCIQCCSICVASDTSDVMFRVYRLVVAGRPALFTTDCSRKGEHHYVCQGSLCKGRSTPCHHTLQKIISTPSLTRCLLTGPFVRPGNGSMLSLRRCPAPWHQSHLQEAPKAMLVQ